MRPFAITQVRRDMSQTKTKKTQENSRRRFWTLFAPMELARDLTKKTQTARGKHLKPRPQTCQQASSRCKTDQVAPQTAARHCEAAIENSNLVPTLKLKNVARRLQKTLQTNQAAYCDSLKPVRFKFAANTGSQSWPRLLQGGATCKAKTRRLLATRLSFNVALQFKHTARWPH